MSKKKKFIVIGSDGLYEQSWTEVAESAQKIRDKLLKDLAEDYGGDWEPTRYTIQEVVGRPLLVSDEQVEAALEIRNKRNREDARQRAEEQQRREYERLKAKFEGDGTSSDGFSTY